MESLLTAQEETGDCHCKTWNHHPDVDLSSSDNVALPHPGLPDSTVGKESACDVGDLGLIPGLRKIPWRKERLPTPVFWPGDFHGLHSPRGHRV